MPRPAPRRFGNSYKPPAKDSARAIADAQLFLCGARSIEAATPEGLARQYRLSLKQAEYMLTIERNRRAGVHG